MNAATANIRTAATAAPLTGTQPAETFVLIVQDERGLVYIDAVANARMQLHRMQADGLVINDRRAEFRYSPHAREIALSLRQQFRESRKIDEPAPWHHAAWEHVQTALEDWDLDSGKLQRTGDMLIGTQVTASVDNTAVGTINRFRQEGTTRRAFVTSTEPVAA